MLAAAGDDKKKEEKDGTGPITEESVARYINTSLATQRIGLPHETPTSLSHRILRTVDSYDIDPSSPTSTSLVAERLHSASSSLDVKALMPITSSMLLVGSCVGMISPIMPYIVSNLDLTTAEFGYVISAFGLAKLIGNIPSAILVERHGRKPYLVYSLLAVGAGTAGIGELKIRVLYCFIALLLLPTLLPYLTRCRLYLPSASLRRGF